MYVNYLNTFLLRDSFSGDRQEITTYSPIVTQPADDETTYSHGEPPKDIQTTTISSVGDQCAYVSSGLYSIGCSQKYIMCSNGAAITRSCDGNLYFNKAKRACSSKEQVLECRHNHLMIYAESSFFR